MNIALVDQGDGVHEDHTYAKPCAEAYAEAIGNAVNQPTAKQPEADHAGAADDNIGEAVNDIGHAGTMPQPRKEVKMPEHQGPLIEKMDTNTITGLLHFIAIQAQTGDEQKRVEASKILGHVIAGLPDADMVTLDDALTVQALAISFGHSIRDCADDPAKVLDLVSHMLFAVWAVARKLEALTGASINDRRFFEHRPVNTSVQ